MATRSRLCLSAAIIGLIASPAWAQSGASARPGTDSGDGLGEIVVTANRRPSTAQDTAASLSVLSSDALTQSGALDTARLQNVVPGLAFNQGNAGQSLIYIRGIGTSILGLGAGGSVATYVDGVYLPNQQQGLQKFGNIERVEVLKGPQATLYGQNATGGAISIVTRQPSDRFGLDADFSYGNYNAVTARSTITGPLAVGVTGLVSVLYDRHDGYAKNITLGNRPQAARSIGVRGALAVDLGPSAKLTLRADYLHTNSSDYYKELNPNSYLYTLTRSTYLSDPWKIRNNIVNRSKSEDYGSSATFNIGLGLAELTSVTSYRIFRSGPYFVDIDSNASPVLPPNVIFQIDGDRLKSKQFYHETYVSTDKKKKIFILAGANYTREKADQFIYRPLSTLSTGSCSIAQCYLRYLKNETWSAFVDGGINITDQLMLSAGVRYTEDRKTYTQNGILPTVGVPAGISTNSRKDTSTSPRVSLEYRPNTDLLIYASVTTGFKAGGFVENNPTNSFGPEKITSYEAGFKFTGLDNHLRLNVSGFYADYRDIQVQQIEGTTLARRVTNADGAKIYGVDFDVAIKPATGWDLSLSGEYLHSRTGNAILCHPYLPCSGNTAPFNAGIQNIKGNPLINAPKWSLNAAANYEFEVASGRVEMRAAAAYRSFAYFNYFGEKYLPNGYPLGQPSYVTLEANLKYASPQGWYVSAYGQNLTNRTIRSWMDIISRFSATLPLVDTGTLTGSRLAAPRTYGVRVGYSF